MSVDKVTRLTAQARTELAKSIVGQHEVLDQLLLVILCGGHALVEGVPAWPKPWR